MKSNRIKLILVQIEEAHSVKWPVGLNDHPKNHKSFEDRVSRAYKFSKDFPEFENVFIDSWYPENKSLEKINNFEELYQVWPDKFYFINNNDLTVIEKSEYDMNACIIKDYEDLINEL